MRLINDGDDDGLTSHHVSTDGRICHESSTTPPTSGYERRHPKADKLSETDIIYHTACFIVFLDLETLTQARFATDVLCLPSLPLQLTICPRSRFRIRFGPSDALWATSNAIWYVHASQ